jgi:hypothetical protein
MRIRAAIIATILAAAATGCGDESGTTHPTEPGPPASPAVLLKDVVIPRLPSPFFHFDYDATGRVTGASYASELTKYDVRYDGGRISALTNITLGNRDTLKYVYDDSGRVLAIQYVNGTGVVYTRIIFTFEGQQLRQLQRERKVSDGFIIDKQMTFTYYADGNVRDITEHRPAIDGVQTETTVNDRYENYDTKINVDGFSLLHTEFFDHLFLLPGLQLQIGNPARQTHTGDGDNYVVDYAYSYDADNRPLTKSGDLLFLSGSSAGMRFQTLSQFSYY